ncbi:hypothetical protein Tco_1194915 [Tanacetum coccineum]
MLSKSPFDVNYRPRSKIPTQSPPHIDDHCCYECGDSLDGIFCQRCTCKSCGKGAHIGYNCPPKVPIISNPEPCHNQDLNETLQNLQSLQQQNLLGTCQQCGCKEYDGVCFYCEVGNGTPIDFSTPEKQHPPEDIQYLLHKLLEDVKIYVSELDEEDFKLFSNPLFDLDEVSLIDVEIDFLLDEFAGELTRLKSIPPGIDNINLDSEGDILFLESLLYDNSSPRLPKAFQANSNTIIETLPISVDSLREEIDIFPGPDDSNHRFEISSWFDYPDLGDSTIDVVEDIPFDVPKFLPTHHALQLDFDFIPSHNDLGSDLDNSSPSGDRNKIYDPGICIEVESTRFLAPLSPVIDTLLPFSSENEDKVFNHGVLAYKEKSPPSSSHRGLKAFQLSPESPMLIHGDNTPNLGVRHLHFYPP